MQIQKKQKTCQGTKTFAIELTHEQIGLSRRNYFESVTCPPRQSVCYSNMSIWPL